MILYYTGTGNSAYTARRIANAIGDEAADLFERLRDNDTSPLESQKPWVIVTPTYAWRIPRIVRDWLDKTELRGSRDIYFVMTCGSEIGNAGSYIEKWCRSKGFVFKGCAEVVMPENYIVMFKAPSPKDEAEIIVRANGTHSGRHKKRQKLCKAAGKARRQSKQRHRKPRVLPDVCQGQEIPRRQRLHRLRKVRRFVPDEEHPHRWRKARLGR